MSSHRDGELDAMLIGPGCLGEAQVELYLIHLTFKLIGLRWACSDAGFYIFLVQLPPSTYLQNHLPILTSCFLFH